MKTIAVTAAYGLSVLVAIVFYWIVTDWDILCVAFAGILTPTLFIGAMILGCDIAVAIHRHHALEQRMLEHRRRAKFKVYTLEGELVEEPVPGTGLVEIRTVVAGPKRNTPQPGRAMRDVS